MINERANNKFLQNGVYKKNNKALGQTLHITRKSTSKNIHSNNPNILQAKTFEQKKYLKKSVNKKLPSEIKNKKILTSYINTNNNINNILSSINNNTFNDISKKHPNISLINNSLILNYMNKINNNISVDSNIISVNTNSNIRSSLTSSETSNPIEKKSQISIMTPNYRKIKIVKESKNSSNKKGKFSLNKSKKINNNII